MSLSRRSLIRGTAAAAVLGPSVLRAAPLDKVTAKGTLRIAVYQDFEPWAWRVDGKLTGIDVDLGAALAAALNVKPDYWDFPAGEDMETDLRNVVWRGPLTGGQVADVLMHMPTDRTYARKIDRVVVGAPYYREQFAMACGRSLDCEVPPPQFHGHTLAAETDSVPDMYLMGSFGGVLRSDVIHRKSGMGALDAVRAGEAEGAMATRAEVEHAIGKGGDVLKLRRGPLPAMTSPGWDIGLAVKDDSHDLADKLEAVMATMVKDGRLAAIFARYGVTWRPPVSS